MVKPKKEYKSWTEKLNLDNLALLGPQWWVVRLSRVNGHETAEVLARALVRNYPDFEFKVYYPAVKEQRKLKHGSFSVKQKPLFPRCVLLNCVMNKEIHDFIRECDDIGGFVGSKFENTKWQINKPKPVPIDEMEAIFRQAKQKQEKSDQAFKEEQQKSINSIMDSANNQKATIDAKPKRRSVKGLEPSKSCQLAGENFKSLVPGKVSVFYLGLLQSSVDASRSWTPRIERPLLDSCYLAKKSFVELELEQIVAETT